MNAKTLKALKGSIRKWERIVDGRGTNEGCENCPLCELFTRSNYDHCAGCPVHAETGKKYCRATPFVKFVKHGEKKHPVLDSKVHCPICLRLAKDELVFLKSLLPKRTR